MDDKEKSVIDQFKDTVSEVVGKVGSARAPTAEEEGKKVAATTNEQVYVPEATDAAAVPAPLFGVPARKRKARAEPKHRPRGAKTARKKTKASAKRKPAAKKRPAKKVSKKRKSKR
jgi:hypothetical protein